MRVSLPMMTFFTPSLASTRPAAQPNLRAKSGVIGYSPTFQRIPSVPKYFRLDMLFPHTEFFI